jgi:hypothetical protein
MPRTELAPLPPKRSRGPAGQARATLGRLGDRISLSAHQLANRFDLVPSEFGRDAPVDESNARSVRAEWVRHLKLWAAYNPEEVFALQVGCGLLGAAVVALWFAIALIL